MHLARFPRARFAHLPTPLEPLPGLQEDFAFHERPLKLLDRPEPIAVIYEAPDGLPRLFRWRGGVHEIARAEGPERIAPEWWREGGKPFTRDYFRVEDREGHRYWLFREGLYDLEPREPRWFLHGLFA